jgi:outer membrane protein assembly factor BamA
MPAIRIPEFIEYYMSIGRFNMAKVEVYRYKRQMMVLLIVIGLLPFSAYSQYKLIITGVDKDSAFIHSKLKLQRDFKNQALCLDYVNKIPAILRTKGYPNASVDSIATDSLRSIVHLYIGENFHGAIIKMDSVDPRILEGVRLNTKLSGTRTINFEQFESMKQKILEYLENNGYPFASIDLDSVQLTNENLYGILKVAKGPLYKIDSIRNFGTARISSSFLQRHLGILNGSIYKKEKLQAISRKITDLPFVMEQQPWNMTLLGTGSILNLYLVPRKSSQINVLVGFLPSNEQLSDNKLLVTGEANVNLKNALGGGESIGLNWQQVQVKSPRLNILFEQPYLFNSPFGLNFNFDLLKKDSSYININALIGLQYAVSSNYITSIFFQSFSTNLLTVDTFLVKNTRRLPQEADLRSLNIGINLEWFNTDYRLNPRKGNDVNITVAAGTKKIRKNNVIVELHDSFDPAYDYNSLYDTVKLNSYQFRMRFEGAHYFRLNRSSTLKTALSGGLFQSPSIFRNELFQIGGYKLLRGFDEESIFASQYGVGTIEYRYLMGQNSFLFAFADIGWAKNASLQPNISNTFIGVGLGMAFETKAGIFNISYASGKRDDTKFNLRQSKIHIGYVNYF